MTLPGLATPIPESIPPRPAAQARTARVIMGLGLLGAFLPLVWADSVGLWGAGAAQWLLPVALLLACAAAIELAAMPKSSRTALRNARHESAVQRRRTDAYVAKRLLPVRPIAHAMPPATSIDPNARARVTRS